MDLNPHITHKYIKELKVKLAFTNTTTLHMHRYRKPPVPRRFNNPSDVFSKLGLSRGRNPMNDNDRKGPLL